MADFPTLRALLVDQQDADRRHLLSGNIGDSRYYAGRVDAMREALRIHAEWVKARTIETVEQLDALPDDSVVLVDDCPARKHMGDWYFANDDGDSYGSRSLALYLPARLLWHPEADHG